MVRVQPIYMFPDTHCINAVWASLVSIAGSVTFPALHITLRQCLVYDRNVIVQILQTAFSYSRRCPGQLNQHNANLDQIGLVLREIANKLHGHFGVYVAQDDLCAKGDVVLLSFLRDKNRSTYAASSCQNCQMQQSSEQTILMKHQTVFKTRKKGGYIKGQLFINSHGLMVCEPCGGSWP